MEKAYAEKLKNWWWYHKVHVLIVVLILAGVGYMFAQSAGKPKADYHIGLVRADACTEEYVETLKAEISAAGEDQNGDGKVLVQLHCYIVDLADDSENAGSNNYQTVASLDADLVGKVSGIFLTDAPQTLQTVTGGIFQPAAPYGEGLWLCLRTDAEAQYNELLVQLKEP